MLINYDLFTTYVFADGTLVAIGWTVLGGAKSSGNASAAAALNQQRSQALMDLSKSLSQPQTTYRPPNSNTNMRCVSQKTAFGQTIINCN